MPSSLRAPEDLAEPATAALPLVPRQPNRPPEVPSLEAVAEPIRAPALQATVRPMSLGGEGVSSTAIQPSSVRRPALTCPLPIKLAFNGSRAAQALARTDVWLVTDSSGSPLARAGDADSIRHAGNSIINLLASTASSVRVGVIHWGCTAPAEHTTGPIPLSDQAAVLRSALAARPNLGVTRMASGLRAASRYAATHLGREPVLYILSDGVEDPGADLRAALRELPAGSVHLLLLDGANRCKPEREAQWRRCGFGSVTRLALDDPQQAARQLTGTVTASLGLTPADLAKPRRDGFASGRHEQLEGRHKRGGDGSWWLKRTVLLPLLLLIALLLRPHHAAVVARPSAPAPAVLRSAPARRVGPSRHLAPADSGLPGVGMPITAPGDTEARPIKLVLVLHGVHTATEDRELTALGAWLQTHANPRTRTTVIDVTRDVTSTSALSAAELSGPHRAARELASTQTTINDAWHRGVGRRLLVTVNTVGESTKRAPATLAITTQQGASTPQSVRIEPGQQLSRRVDLRRRHALAATIARAVASFTNMKLRGA